MKIITKVSQLRKFKRPVLTIGVFDGVHLAHQEIIRQVVKQARKIDGTGIVLTFSPHPLSIFGNRHLVPMLTSLEHRVKLLEKSGVDVCLILDFNRHFAQISADNFVDDILFKRLRIEQLILGAGFRFGCQRKGTIAFLRRKALEYNFKVREIKSIAKEGKVISSSRIRALIKKGKIKPAAKLLGRDFSILGRVKKGTARGRILGYPTANIKPQQEVVPVFGVYAARIKIKDKSYPGIVNIGYRPTFNEIKKAQPVIEAHIFNFNKNIYGQDVEITFVKFLRAEKKFPSREKLIAQIKKDEEKAKK